MIRPGNEADRTLLIDTDHFDPQAVACLVAEGPDGRPAGYAVLSTALYGQPLQPGRYFLHVAVAPAHRQNRMGTTLYEQALQRACEAGATSVICRVDLADQGAHDFAVSRGFHMAYEMIHSELDLSAVDPGSLGSAVHLAEAKQISFTTLADHPDNDALIKRLYDLDEELSHGVPEWSGVMPPLAEYRQSLLEYDPAGVLLAWQHGELVGMALNGPGDNGAGYTSFMGVKSSHRGLGIALALKVLMIEWALKRGFAKLETDNNAESQPILSLNHRLGYRVTRRTGHLVKDLKEPPQTRRND